MNIELNCIKCGKNFMIENVDEDGYLAWESGMKIQEALPKMHMLYRECLISQMCPECISHIFNTPIPGKDDWGDVVTECGICGARLYQKDIDADKCPCCHAEVKGVTI